MTGVRVPKGADMFLFSVAPRQALGLPSLLSSGAPGEKRLGREADRSRPSRAELKNGWSYI